MAVKALGVGLGRIAKIMGMSLKEKDILILTKVDVRIDNRKFKESFSEKAKFISVDEIEEETGHPAAGSPNKYRGFVRNKKRNLGRSL